MRIVRCAVAGLVAIMVASPAGAGVWSWGCQGQLDGQQVIFNRNSMFVVDSKQPLGELKRLLQDDIHDLVKQDSSLSYEPNNVNDGLVKAIEFTSSNEKGSKVTLTEQSSRKTSFRGRLVCGREETTEVTRKVYGFQREGEPARSLTMTCIEYVLTTRGGNPCINGPLPRRRR